MVGLEGGEVYGAAEGDLASVKNRRKKLSRVHDITDLSSNNHRKRRSLSHVATKKFKMSVRL
jgi:hypothetical protein